MKRFLLLIFVNLSLLSFAQTIDIDVVSSCGANYESGGIDLSFTIGEAMVETYEQTNTTLNQGFHQGTYTITDISSVDNPAVQISLYPNPAIDYIKIFCQEKDYMYRLMDLNGKIIYVGPISGIITEVSLKNVRAGQFFIEVYSVKDETRRTFKIVKQ